MTRLLLGLAIMLGACGNDAAAPDAGSPPRKVVADLEVGNAGLSEELTFSVPATTRSVAIVIEGNPAALYGLGMFRLVDGEDLVQLPAGVPGTAMQASYNDEQIGQMPGGLFQSIRLGTFTQIYPYRPDQVLPAGELTLRVASDTPGPVTVTVLMPADDGARTLHLNLFVVSDTILIAEPPPFLDELQTIFDAADLTVIVDQVVTLTGTEFESISDFSEPQEAPGSMSTMLPELVDVPRTSPALDIFVVEGLPAGVGGLSLGTPGPPLRGSYYYGVVIRRFGDAETARVLAHEVSHFLALQHVVNIGISGTTYPDPLDDTTSGQGNLMENGDRLTSDQAWALQRSPLLQLE